MNESGNERTTGFVPDGGAGGAGGKRWVAARWCASGRARVVRDETGWPTVVVPLCGGSVTRVGRTVTGGRTGADVVDGLVT